MRAGAGFGLTLDAEDRPLFVAHSFHGLIVEIDVGDFDTAWPAFRVYCEAVILRGDGYFATGQFFDGPVGAAMTEL